MRRLLLGATLAVILAALLVSAFTPPRPDTLPERFDDPVLAAELVKSAAEIRQVYGTDAPDCVFVEALRRNTTADFFFIAPWVSIASWVIVAPGRRATVSPLWRAAVPATGLLYAGGGVICLVLLATDSGRLEYGLYLVAVAILLQLAVMWRDDGFFDRPSVSGRRRLE